MFNAKKAIKASALVAVCTLAVVLAGCYATIGPGNVGIVVKQTGHQRGVSDFPVQTGRVFYNPIKEDVIEYPTYVQTAMRTRNPNEGHPQDESITFTTKDAMVVNCDISLSYHLDTQRVPNFFVQFHLSNIDDFTYGFLHNIARDKMNELGGGYTVEDIMGDNGPYLKAVREAIQQQVLQYGVSVDQFGFIGAPRPPAIVVNAINAKVQAQQIALQKQNEVQQAKADADKAVAIAQGQADANKLLTSSITPALIEWRKLDLQNGALYKWDGRQPSTLIVNGANGGGAGLLLQMPVSH